MAYLASRCFAFRCKDVAAAIGYSSAGGVAQAIKRIETTDSQCSRIVNKLAKRLAND